MPNSTTLPNQTVRLLWCEKDLSFSNANVFEAFSGAQVNSHHHIQLRWSIHHEEEIHHQFIYQINVDYWDNHLKDPSLTIDADSQIILQDFAQHQPHYNNLHIVTFQI